MTSRDAIARAAQQMDALVVGPQLKIVEPFAEHLAVERRSRGRLDRSDAQSASRRDALDRAQELDELGQFGIGDGARRHAPGRQALVDQRRELLIIARA